MEGFEHIKHTCHAVVTLTTEILWTPCCFLKWFGYPVDGIKGLFYVLRFGVELKRCLIELKQVWRVRGLRLAYAFVRLSSTPATRGGALTRPTCTLNSSPCLHLCPTGKSAPGAASEWSHHRQRNHQPQTGHTVRQRQTLWVFFFFFLSTDSFRCKFRIPANQTDHTLFCSSTYQMMGRATSTAKVWH